MKMKIAGIAVLFLVVIFFYVGWRTPSLSANHGKMDTHLYLSGGIKQPLIVAFGGGSGGNDWERNYLKDNEIRYWRMALPCWRLATSKQITHPVHLTVFRSTRLLIRFSILQIELHKSTRPAFC